MYIYIYIYIYKYICIYIYIYIYKYIYIYGGQTETPAQAFSSVTIIKLLRITFLEDLRMADSEKQMNYRFKIKAGVIENPLTIYPKNDS